MSQIGIQTVTITHDVADRSTHDDSKGWFMHGGSLRGKFCYIISEKKLAQGDEIPTSQLTETFGSAAIQYYLTFRVTPDKQAAQTQETVKIADKGWKPDEFVADILGAGRSLVM